MKTKMNVAPKNRFAGLIDDEEEDLSGFPEPPQGEKEREEYWNDTIFETIACLRAKLRSKDQQISLTAAQEILALSRTSMRHGKRIDGTGDGCMTAEESEEHLRRTIVGKREVDSARVGVPASAGAESKDRLKPGLQRSKDEDGLKPELQQNQSKEDEAFEDHVVLVEIVTGQMAEELKIERWQPLTHDKAAEVVRGILKKEGSPATGISEDRMHRLVKHAMHEIKRMQDAEDRQAKQNPANSKPPTASVSG